MDPFKTMAQMRHVYRRGTLSIILLILALGGLFAPVAGVPAQRDGPPERSQALARLQEILARPEFQWEKAPPTVLERLWEWIGRWLFNTLSGAAGQGRLATVLLGILGVTVLLLVVLYIAIRLRRQFVSSVEQRDVRSFTELQDADTAIASAESAAHSGDYRLALRYLYLSSLLLLHERGLINYDRTRTNREYLQTLRQQPQLAAILQEVVGVFERSWYGLQTPDAKTYEAFTGYVKQLRELR